MLTRLRWSAFGLRGRIVGSVVVTAFVTLGVAAIVLLPQLEHSLKNASKTSLVDGVKSAEKSGAFDALKRIQYAEIVPVQPGSKETPEMRRAEHVRGQLQAEEEKLATRLGASSVTLFAYFDETGQGHPVASGPPPDTGALAGNYHDVSKAFLTQRKQFSFGTASGTPMVDAAIPLTVDSVLAIRTSISGIPSAVDAVRKAFGIAVIAALLMTVLVAIPLGATLVRRLHRLRQAALQLAVGGDASQMPLDRARDEVGDLARSFAIMSRRLRQQEEARRAFVATASHELRTPLASLNGMLELLDDDLQADDFDLEDATALLARARAQSQRLARLAADLLDLSRIDADVALRSEPVELAEIGRAVLAEFDLAASERGVTLVQRESGGATWATGDPGSIARILRILLDNALRMAPRDTAVTVTVSSYPQPALSVSDGGPGIAPEERALIFERFKRGRDTGGQAGFGLGLAIGRELAQRMHGTLTLADPDRPGATFTLSLPAARAPEPESLSSTAGV
jgi:signal transduction histidine kinase